ncbi:hypothetical protein BC332_24498 [Capsicum chinense]|nr:hypothetical protein BC332_24498 [Capsicum chinense]
MVVRADEKERLQQELTRGFSGELKVIPIIGMGVISLMSMIGLLYLNNTIVKIWLKRTMELVVTSNSPVQSLISEHREEFLALREKVSSLEVFLKNFEKSNVSREMTDLEAQIKEVVNVVERTIQLRVTQVVMENDDILRVKAHERLTDSRQQAAEDIDRVRNESPKIQDKGKQASRKLVVIMTLTLEGMNRIKTYSGSFQVIVTEDKNENTVDMAHASVASLTRTIESLLTSNSLMRSLSCDHREEFCALPEKIEVEVKEVAIAAEYTIQLRLTGTVLGENKSQKKKARRRFRQSLQQVAEDIDRIWKESIKIQDKGKQASKESTVQESPSSSKDILKTIQLLNKNDIDILKRHCNYMHICLVQIAFRPLTLKGLPETFLAALRDARNLNFRKSLMGSIESTLAYGPGYFNTQPNRQLSLTDVNILHALTLNVKTHGYDYAPGSELIGLSYENSCKLIDDTSDCTMLIKANFIKCMVTTRRPIRWDEIDFPKTWILNSVTSPKQLAEDVTNSELTHVTQNSDGRICL